MGWAAPLEDLLHVLFLPVLCPCQHSINKQCKSYRNQLQVNNPRTHPLGCRGAQPAFGSSGCSACLWYTPTHIYTPTPPTHTEKHTKDWTMWSTVTTIITSNMPLLALKHYLVSVVDMATLDRMLKQANSIRYFSKILWRNASIKIRVSFHLAKPSRGSFFGRLLKSNEGRFGFGASCLQGVPNLLPTDLIQWIETGREFGPGSPALTLSYIIQLYISETLQKSMDGLWKFIQHGKCQLWPRQEATVKVKKNPPEEQTKQCK